MESKVNSKTILLINQSTNWNIKTLRTIYIIFGTITLIYLIYRSIAFEDFDLLFQLGYPIYGTIALFTGLFLYSEKSRFSKKVKVNEKGIYLKSRVFKKGKFINWSVIKSIEFSKYQFTFELNHSQYIFHYKSNPEYSIAAKRAIREVANLKGISVTGG